MTISNRSGEELLEAAAMDPPTANDNSSVHEASTAVLLGELQAAARSNRLTQTSQADRMVAMRVAAKELSLHVRDGELQSYLWQDRNGREALKNSVLEWFRMFRWVSPVKMDEILLNPQHP
jgi:hypothetical protein